MTTFFQQLYQKLFGKRPQSAPLGPLSDPEADEISVPEVTAAELQQQLTGEHPPLLLDVREPYEWRQVHIPAARHIPMNEVPHRLAELPPATPIVVFCAHGMRSYDVAGYLIDQGYQASSLAGGITAWVLAGGDMRR